MMRWTSCRCAHDDSHRPYQRLYQRLSGRYEHIEVVGFTDRVWEYMEEADLMLTSQAALPSLRAWLPSCPFCWEPFLQQEQQRPLPAGSGLAGRRRRSREVPCGHRGAALR